ncbi:RNA 2'-phosphotransferase [Neolewinella aurantiaca]|uniref:Probable RNA 2'-phosphotransferase n=1 Tax=Neolewinella aurantiaca TaxID=2602767 RepID=A0A5C7FRR4_9BACT|nr:RNA 2'-phosphotransferase [Neolewinella aurantiaca]TXF88814.1 RNA 2'-phosphotransferase [Neolewinella aurantiaca]
MNPKKIIRTSRKLSLVLRHKPETIGLELDAQGWADVKSLLHKMAGSGTELSLSDLEKVVEENDKKRFAFSEDGRKIRASQGHSIDIDLNLEPLTPPAKLFHGTAVTSVDSILKSGLEARSRQHVHLSLDLETATKVGARHGKPVVLTVDAGAMHAEGYKFYCSANNVWLTEEVPARFLSR